MPIPGRRRLIPVLAVGCVVSLGAAVWLGRGGQASCGNMRTSLPVPAMAADEIRRGGGRSDIDRGTRQELSRAAENPDLAWAVPGLDTADRLVVNGDRVGIDGLDQPMLALSTQTGGGRVRLETPGPRAWRLTAGLFVLAADAVDDFEEPIPIRMAVFDADAGRLRACRRITISAFPGQDLLLDRRVNALGRPDGTAVAVAALDSNANLAEDPHTGLAQPTRRPAGGEQSAVEVLRLASTRRLDGPYVVPGTWTEAVADDEHIVLGGRPQSRQGERAVAINLAEETSEETEDGVAPQGEVAWVLDDDHDIPVWEAAPDGTEVLSNLALDIDGAVTGVAWAEGPDSDGTGQVVSLDAATGELRWLADQRVRVDLRDTPVGDEDTVVGLDPADGSLVAIDRDRGALRWRAAAPATDRLHASVGDEQVAVGDGRSVRLFDRTSGQLDATVATGVEPAAPPVIDDDYLFVPTDRNLLVYDTGNLARS